MFKLVHRIDEGKYGDDQAREVVVEEHRARDADEGQEIDQIGAGEQENNGFALGGPGGKQDEEDTKRGSPPDQGIAEQINTRGGVARIVPVVDAAFHKGPGVPFAGVGMAGSESRIGAIHFLVEFDKFSKHAFGSNVGISTILAASQGFTKLRRHKAITGPAFVQEAEVNSKNTIVDDKRYDNHRSKQAELFG